MTGERQQLNDTNIREAGTDISIPCSKHIFEHKVQRAGVRRLATTVGKIYSYRRILLIAESGEETGAYATTYNWPTQQHGH